MRLCGSGFRKIASSRCIPSHWTGGVFELVVALDAARRPWMLNVSPFVALLLLLFAAGGC